MDEELSHKCNLIVGQNGSGKSNFLEGNFSFTSSNNLCAQRQVHAS